MPYQCRGVYIWRATKYIHKYIFRGHDWITAVIQQNAIKAVLGHYVTSDARAMYSISIHTRSGYQWTSHPFTFLMSKWELMMPLQTPQMRLSKGYQVVGILQRPLPATTAGIEYCLGNKLGIECEIINTISEYTYYFHTISPLVVLIISHSFPSLFLEGIFNPSHCVLYSEIPNS